MASITYDGHSIIIDSRRVWLVSGTIDYARTPHQLWRDRIRAARQAGLNCIETAVCWNVHEPQPGKFNFEGDADLKAFVKLIATEGMWCILRPGPYVGDGYDMGGMPAWLLEMPEVKLRQACPAFLQVVARYLDAVMSQVKSLQVTESKPGPIVLVQNEHQWFAHHDDQAEGYIEVITRFLRESGCAVPLTNRNNLWQQVPGTIDTWHGDSNLFINCRQLRALEHDTPCIVSGLITGVTDTWNSSGDAVHSPDQLLRAMAAVSASGGMFNLAPFAGGTNFAFAAGRLTGSDDQFVTTDMAAHSPIDQTGTRTEKYIRTKRLCTFLSHFAPLMSHLHRAEHHTVAATTLSVIQQTGSQGSVVFVWRETDAKLNEVELTTPDGRTVPVHLGDSGVAWIVLNANLEGVATLDLTSLRPWAFVERRLLVLFGPAGAPALVSIDGTLISAVVPATAEPLAFQQDALTILILNEEQIDATYLHKGGLYVGAAGLDGADHPLPHPDFATYYAVDLDGKITRHKRDATPKRTVPRLGDWRYADVESYVNGTAPRFATLNGPRSLEACGADFGYGWYRVRLHRSRAKKCQLLLPQSGDRLHLYMEGKLKNILGVGPGATSGPLAVGAPGGDSDLVFLADNLGRFSQDLGIAWPKGLYGHLLDVKPVRLPKPKVTAEPRVDPFEFAGYVPRCSVVDRRPFPRHTFDVSLSSKKTLVLEFSGDRPRSIVLVNNKPAAIDMGAGVTVRVLLGDALHKGKNRITLAYFDESWPKFDVSKVLKLYEVVENLTEKADFWYARWQMPAAKSYIDLPRTTPNAPAFFRTTFSVSDATQPLMVDLNGMSKGQIFLNGYNVGRYFLSTHTGKKVPPQKRYYLPECWLSAEADNELILFDEHGKTPSRVKIV